MNVEQVFEWNCHHMGFIQCTSGLGGPVDRPWRASPLGQARSSWPLCSLERERAVELRIGALRCSLEIVNFLQAGRVEELGAEERSSEVGLKSI